MLRCSLGSMPCLALQAPPVLLTCRGCLPARFYLRNRMRGLLPQLLSFLRHALPCLAAISPVPQALLGGISNVLEALRAEGVPAAAVRAVACACLRFVDGELLNALLLRRDCCSVSAAKVG